MSDNKPVPFASGQPPERRLSSTELEAVIRRATELEAAGGGAGDTLSEEEVLRIGRELGLAPIHVRQALAEQRGQQPAEPGLLARVMGPGYATATRVVQGTADEVRRQIEAYLLEMEHMVIDRRLPEYTRYQRGSGLGTAVRRAATQLTVRSRFAEFGLKELDVAVQPLEDGYCLVNVGVELRGARAGTFAGMLTTGTVAGVGVGTVLGIAIDPLIGGAALMSLMGAGGWVARPIYANAFQATQRRLEGFLDRVQAGEIEVPAKTDWRQKLGGLIPPPPGGPRKP